MSDVLLRLKDLSVGIGGVVSVSGLNLELRSGERVALSGESGSGKTTLLRTIAGLTDPAAGEIEYLYPDVPANDWPRIRRATVYVSQQPLLLESSIGENLAKPFDYRASEKEFPEEEARAAMARLGLSRYGLDRSARSLSVGEQLRVCLIRAMLLEPRVVLLDEPTSALDEESAAQVEDYIREESRRRPFAAFIASHNDSRLRLWCDRTVELREYRRDIFAGTTP